MKPLPILLHFVCTLYELLWTKYLHVFELVELQTLTQGAVAQLVPGLQPYVPRS